LTGRPAANARPNEGDRLRYAGSIGRVPDLSEITFPLPGMGRPVVAVAALGPGTGTELIS
jgi:hypothetical protein